MVRICSGQLIIIFILSWRLFLETIFCRTEIVTNHSSSRRTKITPPARSPLNPNHRLIYPFVVDCGLWGCETKTSDRDQGELNHLLVEILTWACNIICNRRKWSEAILTFLFDKHTSFHQLPQPYIEDAPSARPIVFTCAATELWLGNGSISLLALMDSRALLKLSKHGNYVRHVRLNYVCFCRMIRVINSPEYSTRTTYCIPVVAPTNERRRRRRQIKDTRESDGR